MSSIIRLHNTRVNNSKISLQSKFNTTCIQPIRVPTHQLRRFSKYRPRPTEEEFHEKLKTEIFNDEIPKVPTDTLKVVVGAGEATSAPPLGPVLGQYQLNIVTFCKEFNAKTSAEWEKGIPLPVKIKRYANKSYEMIIKPPTLKNLLNQVITETDEVTIEDLFWVCQIHSINQGWDPIKQGAPCLFGSLNSWHKRISIIDKKVGPKVIKAIVKKKKDDLSPVKEETAKAAEKPADAKADTKEKAKSGEKDKSAEQKKEKSGDKEKGDKDKGDKKDKKK